MSKKIGLKMKIRKLVESVLRQGFESKHQRITDG
jgi:hypothetical protein